MIPGLRELQTRGPGEPPTTASDFVRIIRTRLRLNFPLPEGMASAPVVHAEINQGRWIARCPFCAGAELIDLEKPRFYCLSCYNATAGHKWLKVRLPRARAAIEAALEKRPHPDFMSWEPGMAVEELLAAGPFHRSWTAPRTWTTGELVTAAIMNTHVRDDLLETAPAKAAAAGEMFIATGANAIIQRRMIGRLIAYG